jgi:hypothetical protein
MISPKELVITFLNGLHATFSLYLAGLQILRAILTVLFEVQQNPSVYFSITILENLFFIYIHPALFLS